MKQKEMSTGSYLLIIAVASIFSLFVYIAWISAPNYRGYCKAAHRYLTDEEKINSAVKTILAAYPPVIDIYEIHGDEKVKVDVNIPKNPLYYKSVEEFLEVNPNCCKLSFDDKGYIDSVLIYRAMGDLSTIVNVKYKVRYYDDNNDLNEEYRERLVAVTNCGRSWYP
jgi:hypothetical protein